MITDPTRAHSGNNYLQLSATTAVSTSAGQIISVNPGDQLTFGGWAYIEPGSASATGVAWDIWVADANGNVLAHDGSAVTTQGAWTYLSTNYTVPAGGASVGLYCQIYQPTGLVTARFDDAFLTGASGQGVRFYHADHLGSARLLTDSGGNITAAYTYLPFGQEWNNPQTTTNHYKFTGKERDSESGNDNFEARYYSSNLARFMSPDPANFGANDESPQTWNMYSYVANDPLNATDPKGLDCFYTEGRVPIIIRGDCSSVAGSGVSATYVPGKIDENSGIYDPKTNQISFTFSNEQDQTGGTAVISLGAPQNSDNSNSGELSPFAVGVLGGVYQRAGFLTDPKFVLEFYVTSAGIGETLSAAGIWEGAGLLPRLTNVSEHAFARMAQNRVSMETLQEVLTKGTKYFDPKNGTVQYIYNGIRASVNPKTGLVTTLTRGAKLVAKRFVPVP